MRVGKVSSVVRAAITRVEHDFAARERGCQEIQGFLIARPMPAAALEALLDASPSLLSAPQRP